MDISHQLKPNHDLIIYPIYAGAFAQDRRKLFLSIVVILLFLIVAIWPPTPARFGNVMTWLILLFLGLCLVFLLLILIWGPLLIMNEQEIEIHTNPFLKRITLSWDELAALRCFETSRDRYLDFSLSPGHLEAFLRRQPPLTRNILVRRLNHFHAIARLSERSLPCSLSSLLASIQERYPTQIQQYHIALEASFQED